MTEKGHGFVPFPDPISHLRPVVSHLNVDDAARPPKDAGNGLVAESGEDSCPMRPAPPLKVSEVVSLPGNQKLDIPVSPIVPLLLNGVVEMRQMLERNASLSQG